MQHWLKFYRCVHLVYPHKPVLCSIGFLQHIQLKVLVANLCITNSIVTRRTFWEQNEMYSLKLCLRSSQELLSATLNMKYLQTFQETHVIQ